MSIARQPRIAADGSSTEYVMTATGRRYRVTVTGNPEVVDEWLQNSRQFYQELRNLQLVLPRNKMPVGLAIQWNNPNFASTLQICIGCRVLVVELFRVPIVPWAWTMMRLRLFLSDPGVEFGCFLDPQDVRRMLFFAPHSLQVNSSIHDLRMVVPPHHFYAGLAELIYAEQAIGGYDLGHPQGPPWHLHHALWTEQQLTVVTLLPFAAFHIAESRLPLQI